MKLCGEWTAYHDHMPGKGMSLRVSGQVCFNTGGWSVELKPREPQGFNPKMLLLDLVATQDGAQTDVETEVEASWSEQTDFEYDEVSIHVSGTPEGDPVEGKTIRVKDVH
jgi:hypothetical protein